MSKQLTRDQILRLVQYLISEEDKKTSIEMELIERSGFAEDVVSRASYLNRYVIAKETLEKLLREIKDAES